MIDQKIDERFDRSDNRVMDLLASDVTNLRAAFDSFWVSNVPPTTSTSAYTSPTHTPIASMMATPLAPRMDPPSSSSTRSSSSCHDLHFTDIYRP